MGLDGFWLSGQGLPESTFCTRRVLFPQVEDTQFQVQLRPIAQIGPGHLESADRRIHLLWGSSRVGQQRETIKTLRILLQDKRSLSPGLVSLASKQIDRPELEPNVKGIGSGHLRLQEIWKRLRQLAELVIRDSHLPDGPLIRGVQSEHVPILEDCLSILFSRGVLVTAFLVPRFLGFWRPGAASDEEQPHGQERGKPTCRLRHGLRVLRLSLAGIRLEGGTWPEYT